MRVGLLGCGNIGGILARHLPPVDFVSTFDLDPERSEHIAASLGAQPCATFDEFIAGEFDMVIEAASVQALTSHAEAILKTGKDLLVLSVGALAESAFRDRLIATARRHERKIRIPSGALFGLDNAKIGRISGLEQLLLRTTKSPCALDLALTERTLLFRGSARDCIQQFPRNVNVAVALSLAAGHEAMVELWADPAAQRNTHEILIRGDFGQADIHVANLPSPDNPATSYLAALSVLSLLHDLDNPLVVGT